MKRVSCYPRRCRLRSLPWRLPPIIPAASGKAVTRPAAYSHDKNRQQHSGKRPAQGASHNGKQPPKGKPSAQGNRQYVEDGHFFGNPLPPKK